MHIYWLLLKYKLSCVIILNTSGNDSFNNKVVRKCSHFCFKHLLILARPLNIKVTILCVWFNFVLGRNLIIDSSFNKYKCVKWVKYRPFSKYYTNTKFMITNRMSITLLKINVRRFLKYSDHILSLQYYVFTAWSSLSCILRDVVNATHIF